MGHLLVVILWLLGSSTLPLAHAIPLFPWSIFGSHSDNKCHHDLHHLVHCADSPNVTKTVGIFPVLLGQMRLFAQYSAAAYCANNSNSPGTFITCDASHNCPLVESDEARSANEFEETKVYDDHWFIAIDDVQKLVVLAFRGAQSKKNWRWIFHLDHSACDLCEHCEVHNGFWSMWTAIREKLFKDVDATLAQNPTYRFVVTGHSMGGALATLAAASFRMRDSVYAEKTELFSYAAPRVGNGAMAEFLTKQSDKSWRITNGKDYVPRLPPASIGYMHMSPEYWIERNGNNPRAEDISVLTGLYNNKGNSGSEVWDYSEASHDGYFMEDIAACGRSWMEAKFGIGSFG